MLYWSNIFALCCCVLLPTFVGTGAGRPAVWTGCCVGDVEFRPCNDVVEDDDDSA